MEKILLPPDLRMASVLEGRVIAGQRGTEGAGSTDACGTVLVRHLRGHS